MKKDLDFPFGEVQIFFSGHCIRKGAYSDWIVME